MRSSFLMLVECNLDIYTYVLPPSLYDGCLESVVRETRFSRDNHLGTEGVLIWVMNYYIFGGLYGGPCLVLVIE
jgi:hypothetical protein